MKEREVMKKRNIVIIGLLLVVSLIMVSCAVAAGEIIDANDSVVIKLPNEAAAKISKEIIEHIDESDPEKPISVMVWFEDVDLSDSETAAVASVDMTATEWSAYLDSGNVQASVVNQYIQSKRASSASLYSDYNSKNAEQYLSNEQILYSSRYSPVIICSINAEKICQLATEEQVLALDYYCEINQVDLATAMQETRINNVHNNTYYGYTGEGVKIGVYEVSLPSDAVNDMFPCVVECKGDAIEGSTDPESLMNHAAVVMDIITAVAPDAEYYMVATDEEHRDLVKDNATNMEQIEWLIDKGVNIISASRTIGGDGMDTYGSMSKWIDHIAYNHDIHFVKSAGNYIQGAIDEEGNSIGGINSGGMSYNAITVGNVVDTRAGTYDDFEIFVHPEHSKVGSAYYNGSTNAYKPDICAPGSYFSTTHTQNVNDNCGTSFSTPLVAGTIALLCEQSPDLLVRQDVVKAILTASVNFNTERKFVPDGWSRYSDYSYMKYGAGVLDAQGACWVVSQDRYIGSSIASGTEVKTHRIHATDSDDRIRVSLAYLKYSSLSSSTDHTTTSPTTRSLANLDLYVYDSKHNLVASSTTTNNNVEIVEFDPRQYDGDEFIIEIERIITSNDPAGSIVYGLAWR